MSQLDCGDEYEGHIQNFVDHARVVRMKTMHAATRKVMNQLGEVSVRGFYAADLDGS